MNIQYLFDQLANIALQDKGFVDAPDLIVKMYQTEVRMIRLLDYRRMIIREVQKMVDGNELALPERKPMAKVGMAFEVSDNK